ncbi:MAG: SDR family NAD(P)-dependent oxidoreductase [Christensenellales bacterium]|jgi:L-fucose dehydrogenase
MKLAGKVAIVTGSSKGIGEGIARAFSAEGAKIVVVCRNIIEGQAMAKQLGSDNGNAICIKADVSDSGSVQNMIEEAVKAFGRIDILVNNAGYHNSKDIENTSDEEWDFIQRTNLYSTFYCSKYALPHLKKTHGNIIHISSMVALVGQANAGAYSATKGGQIGMTRNMAVDLSKYGIRVNAICPGWIQTPLLDDWFAQQEDEQASRRYIDQRHPLGRVGTIEDCGKAALYLASEDASFVTGVVLNLDGGITLGY